MLINHETQIFGLIGKDISHSLSPHIQNIAFQKAKINAVYLPFPIKNINGLKYSMKQLNIKGLSVTIPYKIKIRRLIDKLDPLALRIGSVNTIFFNSQNLLEGYNTDGLGAVQAIESSSSKLKLKNKKVLIIGTGGAARAIAFSLLDSKLKQLTILGRNLYKTRLLTKSLKVRKTVVPLDYLLFENTQINTVSKARRRKQKERYLINPEQTEDYDLIINTTPIGMKHHIDENNSPLESSFLFPHQTIFDIVYNPKNTKLIQIAKRKKCNIIHGYKMLLYQGVKQFELFTNKKAPISEMQQTLEKLLK